MKSSEMNLSKYWLHKELRDGYGESGGTSFAHETLKDFLEEALEIGDNASTEERKAVEEVDMYEVNNMLVEYGIAPVEFNFEEERKTFAALIAYYFGKMTLDANDSLILIKECVDYADKYDFNIVEIKGLYLIDMETTREDAWRFANNLVNETQSIA